MPCRFAECTISLSLTISSKSASNRPLSLRRLTNLSEVMISSSIFIRSAMAFPSRKVVSGESNCDSEISLGLFALGTCRTSAFEDATVNGASSSVTAVPCMRGHGLMSSPPRFEQSGSTQCCVRPLE